MTQKLSFPSLPCCQMSIISLKQARYIDTTAAAWQKTFDNLQAGQRDELQHTMEEKMNSNNRIFPSFFHITFRPLSWFSRDAAARWTDDNTAQNGDDIWLARSEEIWKYGKICQQLEVCTRKVFAFAHNKKPSQALARTYALLFESIEPEPFTLHFLFSFYKTTRLALYSAANEEKKSFLFGSTQIHR